MEIELKKLTSHDKEAFRELLGGTDFGGCFCAVWTNHGVDWSARCADPAQPNFHTTAKNLDDGRHVGYLVYLNDQLVGWTGSGPKTSFPLLKTKLGSRLSPSKQNIWSIACLAVPAKFRGKNISEKIVNAVIEEARSLGASSVEAYPVRPFHEPRIFRGTPSLYQRLGFKELGSEKDGDHEVLLVELKL